MEVSYSWENHVATVDDRMVYPILQPIETTQVNCSIPLLLGDWATPLKNMKVNGKDDIPYIMEDNKCQATNQVRSSEKKKHDQRKFRGRNFRVTDF